MIRYSIAKSALKPKFLAALALISTVLFLASHVIWAQQYKAYEETGQLFRNIRVLQDLDQGDIKAARQKLEDQSMTLIGYILESNNFSRDNAILYNQPGLRAAARYWGAKPLPSNSSVLTLSPTLSNNIFFAIHVVDQHLKPGDKSESK
jgi:hypothetical protein